MKEQSQNPAWVCGLAAWLAIFNGWQAARAGEPSFDESARPVLKAMCFHCHGEEGKPEGGLDLRLVRAMLKGGDSGPALEPAKHQESLIWERIEADEMPPGPKKLTPEQKATIQAWIDAGAPFDASEPESLLPGPAFSMVERNHWSFRFIQRFEAPAVANPGAIRTTIDPFLLNKLEAKGLSFSPEADRATLIRRLSFDLLGLPPSPQEVAEFVADARPDAYERLVERLLANPHYGERWGRHWLDVAGYADSDGGPSNDPERPYAHRYRDWLIQALNADRGWNDLICEQLAGDEMLTKPLTELAGDDLQRLIATGFLRLVPDTTTDSAIEAVVARNEVVADTLKVVGSSFLGLTIGCAQCHAHRYDPVSQEDYYRLRAIFEPALDPEHWRLPQARLVSLWGEAERQKAAAVDAEAAALDKERVGELEKLVQTVLTKELELAPEELRPKLREARDTPGDKRTDEQKQLLKDYPRVLVSTGNISLFDAAGTNAVEGKYNPKIAEVRKTKPPEDFVQVLTEVPGQVPATKLFYRGDPKQPKQEIKPGELSVLAERTGAVEIPNDDPAVPTTGRRLAYAKQLTSGKHPLVARVLVNRVWMHHFGRGLVATPADFGTLGQPPSHPELLDRLAIEFMDQGWSLKNLHRTIILSTAYRQQSTRTQALDAIDPENILLGRMSIRRLQAEEIRDAWLAVSGQIRSQLFGPPVPVGFTLDGTIALGVEKVDGNGHRTADASGLNGSQFRRSLYLQVRRSRPLGILEVFDAPTLTPNCDLRGVSTGSTQSLYLLNDADVRATAAALARRAGSAHESLSSRLDHAWTLAFGSPPNAQQLESFQAYVNGQNEALFKAAAAEGRKPALATEQLALETFCQALLASNSFLYVD